MRDDLNELVETALLIKKQNEELQAVVKEAKRLLSGCNDMDREDLELTFKLLKEALWKSI